MTWQRVSTITCNACGKREASVEDRFDCGGPLRWANIQWMEPPEEGHKTREYKDMDLCPDHLNDLLKWVAEQQAQGG